MGIDSREYLRDDEYEPGGTRPSAPMSVVSKIIVVTVGVFLLQVFTNGQQAGSVTDWLRLNGPDLFGGQVWRLLTYAFLHDTRNLLHIGINMYMLYMLGRVAVQLIGDREFLWFYCASAVFAGICSVCFYHIMGTRTSVVGASGAVLAVFTLFAMHYPRQKMYLFGIVGIETRWLLAAYVAYDALPVLRGLATSQLARDNTAHSAHLGGLIFGWLYCRWNMRLTRWWDQFGGRASSAARQKSSGLKVFSPPAEEQQPDLSDQVDKILAKISAEGEASLTERERRILKQASQQLKRDR